MINIVYLINIFIMVILFSLGFYLYFYNKTKYCIIKNIALLIIGLIAFSILIILLNNYHINTKELVTHNKQDKKKFYNSICIVVKNNNKDIISDLDNVELENMSINKLNNFTISFYKEISKNIELISDDYFQIKNPKINDEALMNKYLSNAVSLGKIKQQLIKRKDFCRENYCNNDYFNKSSYNHILEKIESFNKIKCE